MKIFTLILIIIALGLIGYNATLLDFNEPLQGNSLIAAIGIIAALCAILLLVILNQSKKVQEKIKGRK